MQQSLLLGLGHHVLPVPRPVWQRQIARSGEASRAALGFMSEDHHRVRNFAVVELPRAGAPLPPELFAERLSLPLAAGGGDPGRAGAAHDVPLQERSRCRDVGLPGDR